MKYTREIWSEFLHVNHSSRKRLTSLSFHSTDLLLTVLKTLINDRRAAGRPLKVVLMSATLNAELFSTYFTDARGRPAPIVDIPGRLYPVHRQYLEEIQDELHRNWLSDNIGGWVYQDKAVQMYLDSMKNEVLPDKPVDIPWSFVALAIAHILKNMSSMDGDILVFIPGLEEMRKVADMLRNVTGKTPLGLDRGEWNRTSIHFLHSSIPAAEQREVFVPPPKGNRRVILATNIAEASVTRESQLYSERRIIADVPFPYSP